jgi:hypothetical protein
MNNSERGTFTVSAQIGDDWYFDESIIKAHDSTSIALKGRTSSVPAIIRISICNRNFGMRLQKLTRVRFVS